MENVSPIISPDREMMLAHLKFLFGRALSGKIEITAIRTKDDSGETTKPRTHFFGVDELEAAAEWAERVNSDPGWNTYVGAALRKDETFPGKAAEDADFLKSYVLWADADTEEQRASARDRYRALGITPALVVVTGRTPTTRAQFWWPIETPFTDLEPLKDALRGIATVLKTDPAVCTGKQLMRLAGGVNWPKKADRILERTEVIFPDNAAKSFEIEQLAVAFPPVHKVDFQSTATEVEFTPGGSLGITEMVEEGREGWTFRYVRQRLREYIGTSGTEPTPADLYNYVAPYYFRRVSQKRPGRGPSFLKQKCTEAVNAYHAGKLPGMGSLDEAVASWAANHSLGNLTDFGAPEEGDEEFEKPDDETAASDDEDDEPFCAASLTGEPPERRWIVPEWIPEGTVTSLYGDGGLGKTLLMQQLACAAATGAVWLGLPVAPCRVLAVLCEDEKDELHRRQNDIKGAMGFALGNPFDDLWLWPRLGRDNTLVRWNKDGAPVLTPFAEKLVSRIERHEPDLLILDTLADFYGGNEIDRVQVNYFVKAVLGGMIETRKRAGSTLSVILLGHPSVAGKASGSGYSGSTAWNAAVRARMYLSRPEEGGSDERVLTRGKANYAKSGDETAVRLIYIDGVLHAETNAEDGDALLWAACEQVVSLTDKAWRGGRPYSAGKGHPRYVYSALATDLQKAGYAPSIARQAIRDCIESGEIGLGRDSAKRGYRSTK